MLFLIHIYKEMPIETKIGSALWKPIVEPKLKHIVIYILDIHRQLLIQC